MRKPKKGDVLYKAWYGEFDGGDKRVIVESDEVRAVGDMVVFWKGQDDGDSFVTPLGEIEEKWEYSRKAAVEKLLSRMQDEVDFLTVGLALVKAALEKA